MMGRLNRDQRQLFYRFNLEEAVPGDHQVRGIAGVLDLSRVHAEFASHYSPLGRPSIDPVLMIGMLIVGYAFAIRSERALCREVQVNLAYRWFCGLGLEDRIPDHSVFSRARNERFRDRLARSFSARRRSLSLRPAISTARCSASPAIRMTWNGPSAVHRAARARRLGPDAL
jgi:transposase